MKMPVITLVEWQKRFGTEKACAKVLANVRWPQGFQCPACGSKKYSFVATRNLYQCSSCRHQVSVTADTLFHATKVPLVKWFWGPEMLLRLLNVCLTNAPVKIAEFR